MYVIKKRCGRCLRVLRDDGTCQNKQCVRYVDRESTAAAAAAQDDTHNAEGEKS